MIYYAKLSRNKDVNKVIDAFSKIGIQKDKVVLDNSPVQKQEGCIFYEIKNMLIKSNESLTIDSLTSLGKNNRELYNELVWFDVHNIPLHILDIHMSTENPIVTTKILLDAFAALSEREVKNMKEGQLVGIEKAKKQGTHMGRARIDYPDNWNSLYSKWSAKEITSKEFLQQSGLKKGTFYNLLKQYQSNIEKSENNLA